ncbi:hypothetical protein [Croceiramulus getboli]|nr:hypothetical protein P8624_09670 [Flavobacteriaceae bacterium YJPT1-3]
MKRRLLKIKLVLLSVGVLFALSCSVEDGEDGAVGPPGPQGEIGPPGQDGADGQDGTNGADGQDGANGQDGADGNANVRSILYDLADVSGNNHRVSIDEATLELLETGVILAYLKTNRDEWYQIPNQYVFLGIPIDINTYMTYFNNRVQFWMEFKRDDAPFSVSAGSLQTLKIVLIEVNSTSSGKRTENSHLKVLEQKGLDLSNYEEVMDYFQLEY